MELLQLRYFFESAKHESFAQTAENHWVPASSVSASVKRLEKELGCQLFDRECNRIVLNENGRKFQRTLGAILDDLESAVEDLKHPSSSNTTIRLLILTLRKRTADAIIAYQGLHPDVRFSTTFASRVGDPSSYDLIIDQDHAIYPEYETRELCSFQLAFMAKKDSPLTGRKLTMRDLRKQPFITMDSESELNSVLLNRCQDADFYPNIVMRTNDSYCYKRCLQTGVGIGLWRKYETSKHDDLSYLTVEDFHARQTMYLYIKRAPMSKPLKDFIDFLCAQEF